MSEPWMQQAPPQATPQLTAQKRCDTDTKDTLIVNGLSLLNVACCGLMVFSSVLTFFLVQSEDEIDLAFVSLYTILFAAILFIYEGLNFGWLEYPRSAYRKQLGFLYKPLGRGLFLIFTGFLCFGLRAQPGDGLLGACTGKNYKDKEDDADCDRDNINYLGIMTGAMLGFNGVVVMFLSCYKPDLVKNRDVPAKKNQEQNFAPSFA